MFEKRFLADDIRAGMVVFLVALPLCLGVALASGAPLISGLIAGIVGGGLGGSIIGMLGGSGVAEAAAGGGMDIASIISQLVSGGVGGGVLMAIVGMVRSGMNK